MRFRVYGEPAPQGSKQGFIRGGRVNMVEVSKKVKPWRALVKNAAFFEAQLTSATPYMDGPLSILIVFYLPKPKTVQRLWPWKKPDIDKLVRATLDGITESGVIGDDAQFVAVTTVKLYADEKEDPGAYINLGAITRGIVEVKKQAKRL